MVTKKHFGAPVITVPLLLTLRNTACRVVNSVWPRYHDPNAMQLTIDKKGKYPCITKNPDRD